MTGSTSTTCSPSTVRTMRKTPWVAGCCGPTFTLRSIVSSSRSWGGRYSVVTPVAALLFGGQSLQRLGYRQALLFRRGTAGARFLACLLDHGRLLLRQRDLGGAVISGPGRRFGGGRGRGLYGAGRLLLERLEGGLDGCLLVVSGEPLRPRILARLLDDHRLLLRHLDLAGALVHGQAGLGRRLDDAFLDGLQVVLLPLLDLGQGVGLAQYVVAEPLLGEQGAQVRMAVEDEAEHLGRLPLVPVSGLPEVANGRHVRVVRRAARLNRRGVVVPVGVEMVDNLQLVQVVHAGQAAEEIEGQALVVPRRLHDLQQ